MRIRCNLRHARGKRTIAAMSEMSGISAGDLSRMETGRLLPVDHQLRGLERAYGLSRLEIWPDEAAMWAFMPDEVTV